MSSEAWVDFIAGWISGGVSVLACQPVDTVLTRMQANAAAIASTASASPTNTAKLSSVPSSGVAGGAVGAGGAASVALRPTSIFRGMISNFGVASLWRGSSCMIGSVPIQNALLMTGYGAGKRWSESNGSLEGSSRSGVLMGVFVGGCTGGILQSFVMSPVELIKVTQQVVGKSASSATNSVVQGLFSRSGAWRGLGATLLRDGIPHGVWFVSYDFAKTEMANYQSLKYETSAAENDIAIPMLSGAFAATTAWAVGYPADLIKTRIQAGKGNGIIGTARDIVNESEGRVIQGLYKGFTLKLLRAIPASAIGFLAYETVVKAISAK